MKRSLAKALSRLVGPGRFFTDPAQCRCYSYDSSSYTGLPDAVILPRSTEEVAAILRLCHDAGCPVFARGAGTGTTGGSVPRGGLVVAMTRMTRIGPIRPGDMAVEVGAGVVTGELQRAMESQGLFYPPDPASLAVCTIGGNVATGAGGPRGVKYGVTGDYVRRIEMVRADGTVVTLGRRTVKGVAGYDLVRLLVGSEGTLGIFTSILLRLLPLPRHRATASLFFAGEAEALGLIPEIFAAGVIPSTAEFIDGRCLELLKRGSGLEIPSSSRAMLLVECDGRHRAVVEDELDEVMALARRREAISMEAAWDAGEQERLWQVRRALSPTLREAGYSGKINEDVCVPVAALPAMVEAIRGLERTFSLPIPTFGHAGDGNLHVNILFHRGREGQEERAEAAAQALMEEALALGGTITGEHGVGLAKKRFLPLEMGEERMELMRRIKGVFDPKGLLNPGKVL